MDLLEYRAGAGALRQLRQGGLTPRDLSAVILPAIGPKWLALYGLDRALLDAGWYNGDPSGRANANGAARDRRLLLFGASAGAWRGLALSARDPSRALDTLRDEYCRQHFTREHSPAAISHAFRRLLSSVLSPEDVAHAAAHPHLDLAIAAVRARGLLARAGQRRLQAATLGAAAVLNALASRTQRMFFERVVFSTLAGQPDQHPLVTTAPGTVSLLTPRNMLDAALASGTVPLFMQGVGGIADAPSGVYLDGGFTDYHLNRPVSGGGISVLFLHQRRIVPTWVDKFLPWRTPRRGRLRDLLLVYPRESFVRGLPGGGVPTRHDFERWLHAPELRMQRWRDVAERSRALGEAFLHDTSTGDIAARVQPL